MPTKRERQDAKLTQAGLDRAARNVVEPGRYADVTADITQLPTQYNATDNEGDLVDTINIDDDNQIPILVKDDFYYVKNNDSVEIPQLSIDVDSQLSSKSFIKGDVIAKGTIKYEDTALDTIELTAGCDYVPKKDIVKTASEQIQDNSLYIRNIIITIIIFILLCFIVHTKNKHKKRIRNFYSKRKKD